MSWSDDVHEPSGEMWTHPRILAGPHSAQDAAARAEGLDWHSWAQRTLEAAAALALARSEPAPRRLVGAERT